MMYRHPLRLSNKSVGEHNAQMWMALNAMTAVLKVFKYLQISNKMNSLWEVLQRAFSDILAFVTILLFILGGFGVFACVLFGDHVRSFHNIPSSMHTLLYFSIGDFGDIDYELMKQANSALAPVFVGLFMVLVVLVALNMFIAILTGKLTHAILRIWPGL
eukprot:COSAG02_NODE_4926_length_4827_cov_2.783418_5_plen_160_part_00